MTPAVDFLRPQATPKAGWVLLAVGLAALVASLALQARYADAKETATRELQARLDLDRLQHEPVKVAPPTESEIRLREAIAESGAPWLATLRTIERTTQPPVYLRSMTFEPSAAVLKLEAEAPSFETALSYVKTLDDEPLLRPAQLISHEEVADAVIGRNVVRFQVSSQWNRR